MDWQTIQECVLVTRNARPQQLRHINRLMLYEGYAAIRTQHYADGEAILIQLLTLASLKSMFGCKRCVDWHKPIGIEHFMICAGSIVSL